MSSNGQDTGSLIDKLEAMAPPQLSNFDAFAKLPPNYKTRTESRGFFTIFVVLLTFLLVLNDIGEFIWGWPDYEFSIDHERSSAMDINVDMVVNMPCRVLSVDLRDSVGDRLFLSEKFTRDGTTFDVGQATALKQHAEMLSARQAISQSRKSRGLFSTLFRFNGPAFKPTYNFQPSGSACRVYGTVTVKKVTANLHITTAGHGYSSHEHVDHNLMNLSHVITEFSFGPYFPDITQPLDNSLELAYEPFISYQYFLHVVPTTYIAPRTAPLHTNQYSVTHYTRVIEHGHGTPGIFFKFDLEPLSIQIHQRTMGFVQFIIRCIGVIGGIFVCMGYAVRVGAKAVEVVTGGDDDLVTPTTVQASGTRSRWAGGELHSRSKNKSISRVIQQGNGWVVDQNSPYGTPYGSPMPSPILTGNLTAPHSPAFGPSPPSSTFGPASMSPVGSLPLSSISSPYTPRSPYTPSALSRSRPMSVNLSEQLSRTPAAGYAHFPPTPLATNSGFGLGITNGSAGVDVNGVRRTSGEGSTDIKKVD